MSKIYQLKELIEFKLGHSWSKKTIKNLKLQEEWKLGQGLGQLRNNLIIVRKSQSKKDVIKIKNHL